MTTSTPAAPAAPDGLEALASEVGDIFGISEAAPVAPDAALEADPAPSAPATPEEGAAAPSPSSEPAAPAPAPEPAPAPAPAAAEPSPLTPVGQPAPASAPAPAANEQALLLASLQATVADLQAKLATATTAQPSGQPAPVGSSPEAETPPQYGFVIPDDVTNAIFSDDAATAKGAIAHLMNGIATTVHANMRGEVAKKLGDMRASLAAEIAAPRQADAQKQMATEYYADFPTHNNPALAPIIGEVAAQLQREFPMAAWGPDYRAAIGTRVNARLAELGVNAPAPAPAPVPAPAVPAPRPAAFTPTTPSPSSQLPTFDTAAEQVAEVFSFRT